MKYTENIIKEVVKDFQNGGGRKDISHTVKKEYREPFGIFKGIYPLVKLLHYKEKVF